MADPDLVGDMDEYRRVHKQYSDLTDIVAKYREHKEVLRQLAETEDMLRGSLDDDLRDLAQLEFDDLKTRRAALEQDMKIMLLPKDPNDEKTSFSKCAARKAATKRLCLRASFSECTCATPKSGAGKWI